MPLRRMTFKMTYFSMTIIKMILSSIRLIGFRRWSLIRMTFSKMTYLILRRTAFIIMTVSLIILSEMTQFRMTIVKMIEPYSQNATQQHDIH